MGLRDVEATLPPGFRFYPRDDELVCHYLYKRIANEMQPLETMVEIDLHICEPWQLPDEAMLGANEWYFFSFRDHKYATGVRANRMTKSGYWKATGKDRPVFDPTTHKIVGMRKTLVFYLERAPNGKKTGWVMHEFRLESLHMPPKEDWVLCRVFHRRNKELSAKSGLEVEQEKIGSSSIHADSPPPPTHQTMASNKQMFSFSNILQEANNPPSTMLNLALLHNFLKFPQKMDDAPMTGMDARGGDEYGFLFDLGLEDQILEYGESPTLETKSFLDKEKEKELL
ncbi:hypothetical protein MRB53_015936 [Persea americana]|uniref:Uncharacterized protein n=1 Tax=Persea americana TaxID=3435 RepID=A0ACC2M225_PERAE|nr:hypothetical protein MRB53_015936 [Persea americana]